MALVSRKAKVMSQAKENLNEEGTDTADTQETMSKDYDRYVMCLLHFFTNEITVSFTYCIIFLMIQ